RRARRPQRWKLSEQVLGLAAAYGADTRLGTHAPAGVWLHGPAFSRIALDRTCVRNGCFRLWWTDLHPGRRPRLESSLAGHDDADQPGDLRRVRLQRGRVARVPRHATVGGTRHSRDDHAPRSLDRDALNLAGSGCTQGAGEAPAGYG